MKGRRSKKRPWGETRPLQVECLTSVPCMERGPNEGDYQVRCLPDSEKVYTCPACLRPIPVGTAHVVVWPEETPLDLPQGVEARRYWRLEY